MTEPKLAQEPKADLGIKGGQDAKEPERENPHLFLLPYYELEIH